MTSHVIAYRSLELLFSTHTFHFNCFFEDLNCVFTQICCLSRVLLPNVTLYSLSYQMIHCTVYLTKCYIVQFILPNVTLYGLSYQMLHIGNIKIICTGSTETFSKLRSVGLNHHLPKFMFFFTVLYCGGISNKHCLLTHFNKMNIRRFVS